MFERSHPTVGLSNDHFQFTPKHRRKAFIDPVLREACRKSFHDTAERLGVRIAAMESGPDPVHTFVEGCKNYSVPQLAQAFKGASSHDLQSMHWDRVKRFLGRSRFWTSSYLCEAAGRITSENIRYSIEGEQGHHWEGLGLAYPTSRPRGQADLRGF